MNTKKKNTCNHPEHDFPSMLYVHEGDTTIWVCPKCGQKSTHIGPKFLLKIW